MPRAYAVDGVGIDGAGPLFAGLLLLAFVVWFTITGTAAHAGELGGLFFGLGIMTILAFGREVSMRPYSLMGMNWAFILLFIVVAGWQQYSSDSFLYRGLASESSVFSVLMCAIAWCVSMIVGAGIAKASFGSTSLRGRFAGQLHLNPRFLLFGTVICLSSLLFILIQNGLGILTSRSAAWSALYTGSIATTQLLSTLLRTLPLYCLAVSIVILRRFRVGRGQVLLQFACCLLANSPTNTPRFQVAAMLFGLAVLISPRFWRGARFWALFFGAFLLLFPLLSAFRRDTFLEQPGGAGLADFPLGIGNFTSGDYDSFTMILYALRFVEDYGVTHGRQMLGALFFFVPRSVWADKPIGSGAMILGTYGHDFTNGSAPLIAEGLVNFGLLGVILFGLAMGFLATVLDIKFWAIRRAVVERITSLSVLYPFLLPLVFFLNRGDMLSGVGYMVSHIAAFSITWLLATHSGASRHGVSLRGGHAFHVCSR